MSEHGRLQGQFQIQSADYGAAGSGERILFAVGGGDSRARSRVEPASVTGRAKVVVVFDEIKNAFWRSANCGGCCGRAGRSQCEDRPGTEGVIEGKKSTQQSAGEAAAEGAAMGGCKRREDKNAKEAVTRRRSRRSRRI